MTSHDFKTKSTPQPLLVTFCHSVLNTNFCHHGCKLVSLAFQATPVEIGLKT